MIRRGSDSFDAERCGKGGQADRIGTTDFERIAQGDHVQPSAAPFAAGGGAELGPFFLNAVSDFIKEFRRKGPAPDTGRIGLDNTDNPGNFFRPDTGTATDSPVMSHRFPVKFMGPRRVSDVSLQAESPSASIHLASKSS